MYSATVMWILEYFNTLDNFLFPTLSHCGRYWELHLEQRPGSSVGIATGYRLDGPGLNPRGGEIFRTYRDRPWGPPSLLYNGYRVFPRSKERPGRDADHHPLLVPWSRKNSAIPLLPLWTVRPVTSLSTCTKVHFTFFLLCTWNNIQHQHILACCSCLAWQPLYLFGGLGVEDQENDLSTCYFVFEGSSQTGSVPITSNVTKWTGTAYSRYFCCCSSSLLKDKYWYRVL